MAVGVYGLLVLAACGVVGAHDPDRGATGRSVFRLAIVEPTAIDPYNAQESEGILVTKSLYEGLLTLDSRTNELQPGVAESWTANEDCTSWTFRLRRGTTFSNGEEVTARSFIDGMTRAAAASAASDVAYHMAGIEGYAQLHGSAQKPATAATFSGLSAPDPHSLVVRLGHPDCEFDKKTLQPVMSPVPTSAGPPTNPLFNDKPLGNGPFRMKEPWRHDVSITLVRNDAYYGPKPAVDEVRLTILPGQSAGDLEYRSFQAGELDYSRIPSVLIPQARAIYGRRDGLIEKPAASATYLLPSTFNPPLDNAEARKAVSYAIDRGALVKGVLKDTVTKATALVPPAFTKYFQAGVCDVCTFDLARARAAAARGGLRPGTRLDLAYSAGDGTGVAITQAIARELETGLGLEINLEALPFKELLQKQSGNDFAGLSRAGWQADYPTPDNFLFPLLSSSAVPPGDNRGRYRNAEFDGLLAQGRAARSEAERVRMYQAAEQIAIGRDVALIPLWFAKNYAVFNSTKWQGVDIDFFSNPTLATIRPR